MAYKAIVKWRGKQHPSQKHKHAGRGVRADKFPATNQTFGKPARGKKIRVRYDNKKLADLKSINSIAGFWNVRRLAGYLFNPHGPNKKWTNKWTKAIGIDARVPYPLPKGQFAIGEGIVSDGATVIVEEERGQWVRLRAGTVVRLNEVEYGTGKMYPTGLFWRIWPDEKTGEVWIEKKMIERI